jgi:hypothetical protein
MCPVLMGLFLDIGGVFFLFRYARRGIRFILAVVFSPCHVLA